MKKLVLIVLSALFLALMIFAGKSLWNALVPARFHATFWQAALCDLLWLQSVQIVHKSAAESK